MHPSVVFRETDPARLAQYLGMGFPLVVGCADGRMAVAHAPVLLAGERLRFHLSAANRLVELLDRSGRALIVVTGPDAYVSPDWYGVPDQVPTWNYISVEAEGPVRHLDREATVDLLDDLAARYEADLAPKPPWTRDKIRPQTFEALLAGIVGFEMTAERFEGIRKLSQNKTAAVVAAAASELAADPRPGVAAIARLMREEL